MESRAGREAFNCADRFPFNLDSEYQAGTRGTAVDDDGTCAAIAGEASLFTAGQFQFVAQDFEQALAGLAEELQGLAIDSGFYNCFL